jgi:hypothetical protein
MKTRYFGKIGIVGMLILLVGAVVGPNIGAKTVMTEPQITLTDKVVEPLFEGSSYFILLSDYEDGGGQENLWAVQLRMDSALGVIECEYDAISLPLIYNQWTEIRVEIDLDGDWMEIFYGGDFLHEKEWTATPNNDLTGIRNIGAVDLYANGATSVYYDDLSLEQIGTGVVWSENFDSYALGSSMHGQGGWKGWDNDPTWTAYVSDDQARSTPHSLDVKEDCDLVHEYDGYTTGQYVYTAYVYIPEGSPPGAPDIVGPLTGTAGIEYDYTFTSVDPESDDIKEYTINWGDGTPEETLTGPFASGEAQTASHIWGTEGTFTITARATDINDMQGAEGSLEVVMPRAKAMQYPLIVRFLQKYPNIFPILRQLLGL